MKKYIFLLLLAVGQVFVFAGVRPSEPALVADTTGRVAGSTFAALPDLIRVDDQMMCYGTKGQKIRATVSLPDTGYIVQWMDSSLMVEKKLIPAGKNEVEIGVFAKGTYNLWALLFQGSKFVTLTGFTLTVADGPVARILDKNRCFSPGEAFILTAEASENCDYAWSYSDLLRVSLKTLTVDGVMGENNQQYVFTVTDRTGGCTTRDTAIVRTGPAAPQVSIDTNTNRLDIKIHWTSVPDATAYHVYSRKWDPYCLALENGGTYTKTAVTNTSYIRSAANVASDTLAFFYVTATNGTCESSASDTVGYKLDELKRTPKGSLNHISYPFDMEAKGIVNASDFAEKIINSRSCVIHKFIYATQKYGSCIYRPEDPEFGEPAIWDGDFRTTVGDAYLIGTNSDGSILQYGELAPYLKYQFKVGINAGYLPLKKAYCRYSDSGIAAELPGMVSIQYWDLENQKWNSSDYMDMGSPENSWWDSPFPVHPLFPLLFVMKQDVVWP